MPLRCPNCFSGDFYGIGGTFSDSYVCRECGFTGAFVEIGDERKVPALREQNGLPPEVYDESHPSRGGVAGLLVLVVLFLVLVWIMAGPHP